MADSLRDDTPLTKSYRCCLITTRNRKDNPLRFLFFGHVKTACFGWLPSFHGMIPSYHDMISSYHAVFGLRHRDKSAKVIGLSGQTRGKGIPLKTSFHRKRLRWRMQTFTMAGANVYDGGGKRLRWRMQTFTMADANVYGKKHILLGNRTLFGPCLFP